MVERREGRRLKGGGSQDWLPHKGHPCLARVTAMASLISASASSSLASGPCEPISRA
jgi:hypothetical protein